MGHRSTLAAFGAGRAALCAGMALCALCSCGADQSSRAEEGAAGEDAGSAELQGDEQVAAENLERAYLDAGFLTVDTDAEARCLATGVVDRLGVRSLQRYGILTEDLAAELVYEGVMDTGDAEAFVDVLVGCVGHGALVEDMVAPEELDETDDYVRRCTEAVTESEVRLPP